ncbi:MAG: hypothetical protein U0174_08065 [Polyangiaceae bacterium]
MGMPPPARLFVIMAAEAPTAVVIRRGPSSWSNIVAWRTTDDVFTEGAWFKGRIFAEKCDLSPDGELFVYAAHKGKNLRTSYSDAWTAVSRPPWLHALALWPLGTTYGGGGRFKGNCQLVGRGLHRAHPDHTVGALELVTGSAPYHASTNEVDGRSGREEIRTTDSSSRRRVACSPEKAGKTYSLRT